MYKMNGKQLNQDKNNNDNDEIAYVLQGIWRARDNIFKLSFLITYIYNYIN